MALRGGRVRVRGVVSGDLLARIRYRIGTTVSDLLRGFSWWGRDSIGIRRDATSERRKKREVDIRTRIRTRI